MGKGINLISFFFFMELVINRMHLFLLFLFCVGVTLPYLSARKRGKLFSQASGSARCQCGTLCATTAGKQTSLFESHVWRLTWTWHVIQMLFPCSRITSVLLYTNSSKPSQPFVLHYEIRLQQNINSLMAFKTEVQKASGILGALYILSGTAWNIQR